jgi:hypothetical protein
MKTLKKGTDVVKKSDAEAMDLVKKGWAYCPKSEYKKVHGKIEQVFQPKKEKPASKKNKKQKALEQDIKDMSK